MNHDSEHRPVLIVPFVWIGDFVRCHSVVRLLRAKDPERPVDMVSSTLCAPIADYMPGVRKVIVSDQPRRRLGWAVQQDLAARLRQGGYGQALVMSRKWKAALAPWLAGIPLRTGFAGEARFGLINDMRWGERRLPRMIDQMGALALPKGAAPPSSWPLPELKVPGDELARWRQQRGLAADGRPIVTLSPGAVGAGKAWPADQYSQLAGQLTQDGASVWVLGGPSETETADAAVTNDSGLMHISAAIGTPTVAIFGPTSPWHWKPLNPVAAILEPPGDEAARERARIEGNDAVSHRRTADVAVHSVLEAVRAVLASPRPAR